ncbi:MAG: hypothetical protein WBS20_01370 [Lysobacterales bacterium]
MKIRRAGVDDLHTLIEFTSAEAREAEGAIMAPDNLEKGIRKALEDESIAMYWLLVDTSDKPVGHISALT